MRYCLFAFDMRWAYVTAVRPLWNEPRPQILHALPDAGGFLVVRSQRIADPEGFPAYWTDAVADDHALHKDAFLIPVVENLSGAARPNLSDTAASYLQGVGLTVDPDAARLLWHHVLAILYCPTYLAENVAGLGQGWPRVPLPQDLEALQNSAALGARLAALLNPDTPVPGVTTGTLPPEIACIAVPSTHPGADREWDLRGWGNRTDAGITMPLRGRVAARAYSDAEAAAAVHSGILGAEMLDIGLNAASYWRGIPQAVWECRIGGYQVMKKWLSYRDHSIIGRPLSAEEVAHVQQTARRIAAVLLMAPQLDASYHDCVTTSD